MVRATSSKSKLVEGIESYIRYQDLRKKEGAVAARIIRNEKRALQEELDKNPDDSVLPYILAHPDMPGSEDRRRAINVGGLICPATIYLEGLGASEDI